MQTLEIKLKVDGAEKKFHLRLTAGGQKILKEKYEENMLATLMGAVDDIDRAVDILGIALGYKDNDNEITDGEEFYDLLVDNGKIGAEDLTKVLTDVAVNSGIIKKDQANSVVNSINTTYKTMFDSLEERVEKLQKDSGQTPTANDSEDKSDSTPL